MGKDVALQPAATGPENPSVQSSLHPLPNIGVSRSKIHTVSVLNSYVVPGLKFILQIAKEHQQWIFCSLFRLPTAVLELALTLQEVFSKV